jgi:hypothetical protein
MARSTGPILAAGAVTWANASLFDQSGFEATETARIVVATGVAALGLSLLDRFSPDLAYGLALAALVTVVLVPVGRTNRSPATRALDFVRL